MIRNIVGSRFINVVSGYASPPYINMAQDKPLIGVLRFNSNSSNIEVFDGNVWQAVSSPAPVISMTPDAERALEWCVKKIQEEQELQQLAETDPTIKDLYEEMMKKKDQIKMVQLLKKKETNESSQSV